MSTKPIPSSNEEQTKKIFQKKVKIGIGVAAVIIISAVIIFIYAFLGNVGEVYLINFKWTDHHPLLGSPYVHVEGTIFNSGSRTAGRVQLIIRIYDSSNQLLKTETMDIGDIAPKDSTSINTNIQYSGDAASAQTEVGWMPYG